MDQLWQDCLFFDKFLHRCRAEMGTAEAASQVSQSERGQQQAAEALSQLEAQGAPGLFPARRSNGVVGFAHHFVL